MDALITNIINNIFHVVWFYNLALEPRYNKKKTFLITAGTGILFQVAVCFLFGGNSRNGFTYLTAYFLTAAVFMGLFLCVLSASHPAKSAFLVSAYYCLWIFIYGLISFITRGGVGAGNAAIWGLRIFLNLFFLFLYRWLFQKKLADIYRQMRSGYGMIAVISCMTFVMMSLLLFYNEYTKVSDLGHIFMMTVSYGFLLMVYILLFYFMAQANHMQELKQMRMHEKLLQEQLGSYERIEQNARQARHDIRHHNLVVMELARQKDCAGILRYLEEYGQVEEAKRETRYCKNHALNSLVSAYGKRAEQEGVAFQAEIQLGDAPGVSEVDLVSILANMMENAVHGCMEAKGERKMAVRVRQVNQVLLLLCQNSCADGILFCDGLPQAQNHEGVGVMSILNTAEKYAGTAHFSAEDNRFTCQVLLNGRDSSGKEE